nr:PD-(D/E)XK nuclease family protein [Solirubrobacterales bacterium]
PLRARLARASAVRREHGFAFALDGTLLTGIVDVLAEEPAGVRLVVDYKTDRVEPGTDLEAYVAAHYAVQQRVYALAVLRAGAERVDVAYAFLERPEQPVLAAFAAAGAGRLEDQVRVLAAGPLGGCYPVTDRPHRDLCLTCPGRRALCSHPEEMTLRASPG